MASSKECYDVLIVGSGSSGAIVASRLAARNHLRVALIEAGGTDWNPIFRIPILAGSLHRYRYSNWCYETEPEAGLNNRRIAWPRGRILGGTSMINGMVYVRGLPSDYNTWHAQGLPGWSWDELQPYFDRSVCFIDEGLPLPAPAVPISRPKSTNPLFDIFIRATQEAGWPVTANLNKAPYGVGYYDFTMKNGERWSTSRAYLARNSRPSNLFVLVNTQVIRVNFGKNAVSGVDIIHNNQIRTLHCPNVILCAGSVNSPALLFHSGIGNPITLEKAGIKARHPLHGVGQNLQDHLLVRVEYECKRPITLYNDLRFDRLFLSLLQAALFKTGPAATFPIEAGAYLKTDKALADPDIQTHFLPGLSTSNVRFPFMQKGSSFQGHGFFASCCKMRPESRGFLVPVNDNPLHPPRIFARYLTDDRDIITLRKGVGVIRDIFSQAAFDGFRGDELAPSRSIQDAAALDAYIRQTANTVFHPVGTCKMGHDFQSVVDARLQVHGLEGLWVADASIMPNLTSTNTHAPTMMIGEKAADLVASKLAI